MVKVKDKERVLKAAGKKKKKEPHAREPPWLSAYTSVESLQVRGEWHETVKC